MEVLQEDSFLREEIINDAKTKAERIIKKAERECEELEKNLLKQIEDFEKKYREQIEQQIEDQKKLKFASIEIEAKKKYYEFCGKLIDEIFDEIRNWLSESARCKDFYIKMIKKAVLELFNNQDITIEIDEYLYSIIDINELKNITLKSNKNIDIVKNNEMEGIFISAKNSKLGIYISLDSFIDQLKKEERVNIYNLLLNNF